jgi:hypothetical protein
MYRFKIGDYMKKLFAICLVAVLLVTSVGVISAADSVSVTATGDLPGSINVKLISGGSVADSAILTNGNGYSTSFSVDDDSCSVVASGSSDYSFSVTGSADSGFVVHSKLISSEVLGSDDDTTGNNTDDTTNDTTDDTTGNSTDDLIDDETDDSTDDSIDDETDGADDETDDSDDTNPPAKVDSKKPVKKEKVKKQDDKKPEKKVKTTPATGFPIVVLVLALMVAIFVPFARKK